MFAVQVGTRRDTVTAGVCGSTFAVDPMGTLEEQMSMNIRLLKNSGMTQFVSNHLPISKAGLTIK